MITTNDRRRRTRLLARKWLADLDDRCDGLETEVAELTRALAVSQGTVERLQGKNLSLQRKVDQVLRLKRQEEGQHRLARQARDLFCQLLTTGRS